MDVQLWACVTTRDRTGDLAMCLDALRSSSTRPDGIVVSDDSPDPDTRCRNREVVERCPNAVYRTGPRAGVCANRNNAVDAVPCAEGTLVSFVDDDFCVDPDFFAAGVRRYARMTAADRSRTILTGVIRAAGGRDLTAGRLSFRGHFRPSVDPESIAISATMFPRRLFERDRWDENIFLGYEEAELCLRALRHGYRILQCPDMRVLDRGGGASTLQTPAVGTFTEYDLCLEAARLYVGVKRYRIISPSRPRLLAFLAVYAVHMTVRLLRNRALRAWPELLRKSRVGSVRPNPATTSLTEGGAGW